MTGPLQPTGPGPGSLAEHLSQEETRNLASVHCFTVLPASQQLGLRLVEPRLEELKGVPEGQCPVSDPFHSLEP